MMHNPLRVLVIDENRRDRAIFKQLLRQSSSSYVIQEASDPLTGLRSFARVQPHCIFFEVLVEGRVATDVLHELKTRVNGRPVPVIVWTTLTLLPLVQAAVQQIGASGWLLKHRTSSQDLERTIRATVNVS